jgi:hypothetical protein
MTVNTNKKPTAELELCPLEDHELDTVIGGSTERPMQRKGSFPEYAQYAFDHGVLPGFHIPRL